MGQLLTELLAALPSSMTVPEPFVALYEWMEAHGSVEGEPATGQLYPPGKSRGTEIYFAAPTGLNANVEDCGRPAVEVAQRFCEFAQTGADGSIAGFWLDDSGVQHIVHVGSGSGSEIFCVLATDPVDFLRLIAIGYEELIWEDDWDSPPDFDDELKPNKAFQKWVTTTFDVKIPKKASKLVPAPALMSDEDSEDPFWHWVLDLRPEDT